MDPGKGGVKGGHWCFLRNGRNNCRDTKYSLHNAKNYSYVGCKTNKKIECWKDTCKLMYIFKLDSEVL